MNLSPTQQTEKPQTANPANAAAKATSDRGRIPMSLPIQKLSVPEIPGFHSHWMLGTEQRLAQALRAGYVFVEQDEVELNRVGLADGDGDTSHSDLGSRVSVISGSNEQGNPQRLYLMKLPLALWDEDQKALETRQEQIAAQLRGDKGFAESGGDASNRYSKKEQANMFTPQRRS